MKRCRILLSLKCNFDCKYCCNKLESVHGKFANLSKSAIADMRYDVFNLTGGEIGLCKPLLKEVIETIRFNNPEAKIYLYTNGLLDLDGPIANRAAGVNIGCHDNLAYVLARASYYKRFHNNVRIHIEDIAYEAINYKQYLELNQYTLKVWHRDSCETDEDIFLLGE